jgi:hypothetical protein
MSDVTVTMSEEDHATVVRMLEFLIENTPASELRRPWAQSALDALHAAKPAGEWEPVGAGEVISVPLGTDLSWMGDDYRVYRRRPEGG